MLSPTNGTYVGNEETFGIGPEFWPCVVFPAEDVSPEQINSLEHICQLYVLIVFLFFY